MREIKFRGRKTNNSKWITGNLAYIKENMNTCGIIVDNYRLHVVDFESVGQYSELKDENGVEIYEGDICYINNNLMIVKNGYHVSNSVLELNGLELDEIHGFYAESPCGSWCLNLGLSIKKYNVSVIGNVYENKDLLEDNI